MQPGFNVTFVKSPLPPIQTFEEGTVTNASFTFPEIILAAFKGEVITRNESPHFFIGSPNIGLKQVQFNRFVQVNFKNLEYSIADYTILPLVSTLWLKSRMFVDNTLSMLKSSDWQDECARVEEMKEKEIVLHALGFRGKLFTRRQGLLLCEAIKKVEKTGAEINARKIIISP